MRMLSFLTSLVALLGLLTNCTDKVAITPPTPVVTTPPSQTIIDAAPLPTKTEEKLIEGSLHPMAYPSLLTGKTDYISTFRTDALPPLPANVELGTLVKPGQPLRMIALGGSLTAGVRNGGLYREGQLTAYPNLVARQMGMADFQSPVYGPQEANGTGFYVYDESSAEYPHWQEVTNQKAAVQVGDPPVLSAYSGKVDNYAVPGVSGTLFNNLWYPNSTGVNGTGKRWFIYQPYLWRYFSPQQNEKQGLVDYIAQTKPFDLFLLEDKAEQWLAITKRNEGLDESQLLEDILTGSFYYNSMATKLAADGKKGVVFTLPNILDYAFMQWYPTAELKSKASGIDITYRGQVVNQSLKRLDPTSTFYLMPTPTVAKLFAGLKQGDYVQLALTDADVMDQWETVSSSPYLYNREVVKMAKRLNLALVDLNAVYSQIRQGGYVAEGGLRIDGAPKGNFFSSDGIYPTAIGQAVIANEVIKALNSTYQSRIPLINVSEFAQTSGAK